MQDVLRALRSLQELDTDIFRARDELRRLPEERGRREAELDSKRSTIAELDRLLHDTKTRIKEIEDHTTIQRQRQRKLEGESAKGKADAALVAAYSHEIRTLKREISECEEEGLQLVERSTELQGQRDAHQEELDAAEAVFAEYAANVEREMAEANGRLEDLEAKRKARMSADVPPDVLGTYDRLLAAREGVALAMLDGRTCQECYMEVPPNTFVRLSRQADLVQCPSCDRILFLAEM